MNIYIDIELVFEIRSLQFCIANQSRYIDKSSKEILYYKSIHEGLKQLNFTAEESFLLKYIKTTRFKIEGFHLLNSFENYSITFLSEIEESYFSEIIQGNCEISYQSIPHQALLALLHDTENNKSKIITSNRAFYEQITELNCVAEFVPLTGDALIQYLPDQVVPWNLFHELENPIHISGKIITGFGRGSKELGFPTANIDFKSNLEIIPGIYAGIVTFEEQLFKAAISVGWCPFYENKQISYEVYILNEFQDSLVGKEIYCEMIYYLRSESSFRKLDDLILAINLDVKLTENLIRINYRHF